jgi:hypothetical protein
MKLNRPHHQRNFLVRELPDVHVRQRVALVQSPDENMRQLIEFSEFPLCEKCVAAPSDGRRIFMVLLLKANVCQLTLATVETRGSYLLRNT